jgi:hypothetical protein
MSGETLVPLMFRVELSLLALSILTVAGRIYARIRILRAIGVHDWFIVAATVSERLPQEMPSCLMLTSS